VNGVSAGSQKNIISALAEGALVLTVNKRLFRHLRDSFDQQMLAEGKSVWSTPAIISYEAWLTHGLSGLGEGWRLLTLQQQQCLWEQEIANTSRGSTLELLQLSKTAEKALQAHHLLSQYNVSLKDQQLTEDQKVFYSWQQKYLRRCQQHQWLDHGQLPGRIVSALEQGEIETPSQVIFLGFDQFSPTLLRLMETLRTAGKCCHVTPVESGDPNICCYAAQDSRSEIELAARWVRRLLDNGAESIGVVVPDLHSRRRQIERIFRQQIDPVASMLLADDTSIFSLSLGDGLADQGVIHSALECLSVNRAISLDQISFFLRSPYLGGAMQEADARSKFDRKLRSFRQQKFSLSGLMSLLEGNSELDKFFQFISHIIIAQQSKDKVLPSVWAVRFAEQLHLLGWPGDRSLLSSEYQAINAWQEKALSALISLDQLLPAISRQRAFSLLRRMSQDIEFQLEGPKGPVQVVGLLESSGLTFDHLWVMGMGENTLPARPQPNPFIPVKLQQEHDMPHSSFSRELQFSEQVITRLKASSPDIVFSYPLRDGDCDLRPSPLLPNATTQSLPGFASFQDLSSLMQAAQISLESLDDWRGPELDKPLIKGGTGLLKDQAHCPFRAFIHHRLHAQGFSVSAPGIPPITRGDLVHLALEKIWKQLHNLTNLLKLDEQQRIALVQRLIAETFKDYFSNRSIPAGQLLKLEVERVAILVNEWLESVEMKREFFQVLVTEQQSVEKIGALQIQLQVDRIDQLENGELIVIDYKTGTDLHAEDFLSDPLIEPQLPIYAVADTDSVVDGVVFAKLRRGECRFIGLVRDKGILGRVRDLSSYGQAEGLGLTNWDGLLHFWRQQLDQLANDFVAGKAMVKPYDMVKSCQYCDLFGICRIQESSTGLGVVNDC
jgi:probable DNA repair protein